MSDKCSWSSVFTCTWPVSALNSASSHFLTFLVSNNCTNSFVANYLSAIKDSFVLCDLPYDLLLDHPK